MGPLVLDFTFVNLANLSWPCPGVFCLVSGPNRRNVCGSVRGTIQIGFFGPEAIGRLLKLCTPGRREFREKRVMAANDPRARNVQRILLAEDD